MKLFKAKSDKLSDTELLHEYFVSRDAALLAIIYKRFLPLLYGVCLKYLKDREEGKDAVMEIFEKFSQIKDPGEIKNIKSWLYVIAKNHCLMILRKEQSKNNQLNNVEFDSILHPAIEDNLDIKDLEKLNDCLNRLKPEQKECVELFFLQEMSYKQVMEKTNSDLKKVKSSIQNGKRNLKICMEEKVDESRERP